MPGSKSYRLGSHTVLLFFIPVLATAWGCDDGSDSPEFTLRLQVQWSGQGEIHVAPNSLVCSDQCDFTFAPGTTVTLTAVPLPGAAFLEWRGGCAGTQDTQTVHIDENLQTCTAVFSSTAQYWAKSYGGEESEQGNGILQMSDGSYLVVASTDSFGTHPWFLRLDASGNVLDQFTIGTEDSPFSEYINGMVQTGDGGFFVTGLSYHYLHGGDIVVMRIDENTNIVWQKFIGDDEFNGPPTAVALTPDGGLLLGAKTYWYDAVEREWGDRVAFLRFDSNGVILWQRFYSLSTTDSVHSVAAAPDGGYLFAGVTYELGVMHSRKPWIIKLDGNGDIEWDQTLECADSCSVLSVRIRPNGGYLLVGRRYGLNNELDGWLAGLDAGGQVEWQYGYGDVAYQITYSAFVTPEGRYLVTGRNAALDGDKDDGWLLEVTDNGDVLWEVVYGGTEDDGFYAVHLDPAGDIVVTGTTRSYCFGHQDTWVLRLTRTGQLPAPCEAGFGQSVTTPRVATTMQPASTAVRELLRTPFVEKQRNLSNSATSCQQATQCAQ
jgi:hypothetical protein